MIMLSWRCLILSVLVIDRISAIQMALQDYQMLKSSVSADCSSFRVTIDNPSTLLSVPESCIGFEIDESEDAICDQEHFPMTCEFQLKELANVLLEANETADGLAATQMFIDSISADCSSFSVTIDDPSTPLSVPQSCIGFEIDESQEPICDQEDFPMTCEFQLKRETAFVSESKMYQHLLPADCSSFSVTIDDPSTLLSLPESCIGFEIDESQDAICDQEHFPMTCEFQLKEPANVLLEANETGNCGPGCKPQCKLCYILFIPHPCGWTCVRKSWMAWWRTHSYLEGTVGSNCF